MNQISIRWDWTFLSIRHFFDRKWYFVVSVFLSKLELPLIICLGAWNFRGCLHLGVRYEVWEVSLKRIPEPSLCDWMKNEHTCSIKLTWSNNTLTCWDGYCVPATQNRIMTSFTFDVTVVHPGLLSVIFFRLDWVTHS